VLELKGTCYSFHLFALVEKNHIQFSWRPYYTFLCLVSIMYQRFQVVRSTSRPRWATRQLITIRTTTRTISRPLLPCLGLQESGAFGGAGKEGGAARDAQQEGGGSKGGRQWGSKEGRRRRCSKVFIATAQLLCSTAKVMFVGLYPAI
jgi:hypothetical protein